MQDQFKGADTITMFCRMYMNIRRDLPVRPSEMGMLIMICRSSAPLSPNHIASFLRVTKPMVTSMVNSMVKRGYLEKRTSESDRRSCILIATPRAHELVAETCEEYYKILTMLQRRMGEQQYDQLITLLTQANEALGEVQ